MSASGENSDDPTGLKPPIDSEGWCTTRIAKDVHYKFVWMIENFSRVLSKSSTGNDNVLFSSEFSILSPDGLETKWKLCLYPNGNKEEDAGKLGLYLDNQLDHKVTCSATKFSIVNVNKEEVSTASLRPETIFEAKSAGSAAKFTSTTSRSWGIRDFTTHEMLKGPSAAEILPEDKLTVVCDVTLRAEKKTNIPGFKLLQNISTKQNFTPPTEQLSTDFDFAVNDKEFSDVKIVCGDKVFDCHRIFLSSRSSVFRAMFQHGMTEAQTRRIEIKELEPEVVQAMLKYIYTGNMNFSTMKPEEMLAAAQMYDLGLLKDYYEEKLCKSLDISNCVDMLVLGDLHEAAALKRDALRLIVKNLSSVVESPDWQNKLISYPVLMSEVLKNVGKGYKPPNKRARTENPRSGRTSAQLQFLRYLETVGQRRQHV